MSRFASHSLAAIAAVVIAFSSIASIVSVPAPQQVAVLAAPILA
ncbi:hypothetical protein [Aurantiacibacter luteus]|nr:hypothetical protein [Aurantiacibacter luteus]